MDKKGVTAIEILLKDCCQLTVYIAKFLSLGVLEGINQLEKL
jgi:hypothetical protein